MERCMLDDLPSFLWGEAINTAIYILNRCPMKIVEEKTSYEAWIGKKPKISYFRVFGCDAYPFVVLEKMKKMDKRSKKCIFVGYDNRIDATSYTNLLLEQSLYQGMSSSMNFLKNLPLMRTYIRMMILMLHLIRWMSVWVYHLKNKTLQHKG